MFRSSRLRQSSSGLTSLPSAVSPAVSAPAATTRNADGIGELNNEDDTDGCDDQVRFSVRIALGITVSGKKVCLNSFQSIYTILIRFPPSKSHNSFPPASHSAAAASSAPHPKAALGRVQSCGSGGQGNNNHNGARNRASSRWVNLDHRLLRQDWCTNLFIHVRGCFCL